MNWFEQVNMATEYIEENISSDIKLEDIAKHCHVSYHYFTKTFSLITGVTLKEYIRNRRITLASYDLSNTNERIIDIAMKYGYSSNESFSRAFKTIHGINPSEVRKNSVTVFTHFPVLHYDIPKPNIISLQYELLMNLEYKFTGESKFIIERDYEKTQEHQSELVRHFVSKYPSESILYRVHHNLSYDSMQYNYLVGYDFNDYQNELLNVFELKAKNAIRFIAKNTKVELIPKIKTIIYNEWQKNHFVSDGIFEIEYLIKNDNGSVDFYYLVSIKN